jgi:hypothetical protein
MGIETLILDGVIDDDKIWCDYSSLRSMDAESLCSFLCLGVVCLFAG